MLDIQDLCFTARSAIEDSTSTPERLTGLWIKLKAAVMKLRKIQWRLMTTKPCAEDILAPLVQSLSTIDIRIGKSYRVVPQPCSFFKGVVVLPGTCDRPSFIITKEQLEVMRSYGLPWI